MALPSKSELVGFFKDVWGALIGRNVTKSDSEGGALGRAKRFLQRLDKSTKRFVGGAMKRAGMDAFRTIQLGYQDGQVVGVSSSWIESLQFTPMRYRAVRALPDEYAQSMDSYKSGGTKRDGRQAGYIAMPESQAERRGPNDSGDLTMKVKKASNANPSRRYTYPKVPRYIMDEWLSAATAGSYYHQGHIQVYSDRRTIFQRAMIRRMRPSSKRKRTK